MPCKSRPGSFAARGHAKMGSDVGGNFDGIVVNEVPKVVRDAPKAGPFAQRADRWFLALGKNPTEAQAIDVRRLISGEGADRRGHAICMSNATAVRDAKQFR